MWEFLAVLALAAFVLGRFRLAFFGGALAVLVPAALVAMFWLAGDGDRYTAAVAAHGEAYAMAQSAANGVRFFWAFVAVIVASLVAGVYAAYRHR